MVPRSRTTCCRVDHRAQNRIRLSRTSFLSGRRRSGLQFLFFASQVIYPLQSVQQSWLKYCLAINPANAAIELFRLPITGTPPDISIIAIGITSTLFLLIIGLFYFRKTEAYFADLA